MSPYYAWTIENAVYQGSKRLEREKRYVPSCLPPTLFFFLFPVPVNMTVAMFSPWQLKFSPAVAVDTSLKIFQLSRNYVYRTPTEILAPAHWCLFLRGLCSVPWGLWSELRETDTSQVRQSFHRSAEILFQSSNL